MVTNEVRTRASVIRLEEPSIVHVTILPGVEESLADAQETFRSVRTVAAGRRIPLLVDMRSMKSQDREARQYYGSPEVIQAASAVALLVESRVSKLLANFFIAVTNPNIPTRIFTDEAEALAWLKGFSK